ncbi:microcin C transport system substrate-binding protein [Rhodovulum sp. ES.010]|uniref:extracellular solute-binding protein n=1 Tax=Rhodovulum sp. ES.010 TaxID=1882821 RepID=UPI0009298601|nr:extracellular solute-binding protein [Rhodovulum sp. ES.010]SIO27479.1 microcin C transport system substrate-binding protein [Rhodovulum sp. ES.010]
MSAPARLTFTAVLAVSLAGPGSVTGQGTDEAATVTRHGISAFGELKYPSDFRHFDYVNPAAPKGGTMSFRGTGASRTFDSLNPFVLAGEPAQGLERLYDTLLVRAYDEADAVYGLLAETVTYPEDRSWVIYRLHDDARFADGAPVTAEDVVFTLETLKTQGTPAYRIRLKDVAGASALSLTEVRVDFAEGAAMRDLIADVGQVPILPAHYYDTVAFDRSTLDPPLGSGPYVVDEVDAGRSITYCRNPEYWATDLPANVGKNNFDCYIYEYFADNTSAFEAFKAGTYLFHEEFTSALWATNYDFPAIDRGWIKREVIGDDRPSGAQGFWMNMRRAQFTDPRVRQAIAMMFNFKWSNRMLFYGLYERTDSFWENSDMQAEGLPEGDELALLEQFRDRLPEAVFTEPAVTPPVLSAARNLDREMLREAGGLLDAAGYRVDDAGRRRDADGEPLRVEFVSDSPAFERIVLPYIENLTRLGIEAVHVQVDPAQMQQRQEEFDYDITIARFVLPLSPSLELRTLFASESADAPGANNLSGLKDPVVDALIKQVIAAPDRDTLRTRVKALDRVLRAQHIWVPNWFKGSHWLAYWDVFGKPAEKPPYDRGTDYWWWDRGKYEALRAAGALR